MEGLGLDRADFVHARSNGRALDAFKARVRRAYRKLVLELHPDRTGNDPEKAKLFQLATAVVKEIETMTPCPRPRRYRWAMKMRTMVR